MYWSHNIMEQDCSVCYKLLVSKIHSPCQLKNYVLFWVRWWNWFVYSNQQGQLILCSILHSSNPDHLPFLYSGWEGPFRKWTPGVHFQTRFFQPAITQLGISTVGCRWTLSSACSCDKSTLKPLILAPISKTKGTSASKCWFVKQVHWNRNSFSWTNGHHPTWNLRCKGLQFWKTFEKSTVIGDRMQTDSLLWVWWSEFHFHYFTSIKKERLQTFCKST